MDLADIHALIDTEARTLGFDLVRVAMIGGASDPTLQVMAERPDTRQLGLSDCEDLSRLISEKLDALEEAGEDPIEGGYRLEVSSPGIDRPLTRLKDYSDWAGHEVRLKLARDVDGATQVTGELLGVEGDIVRVSAAMAERRLPFDAIASAKLVLTDKLIKATAPLSTEGADSIQTVEG